MPLCDIFPPSRLIAKMLRQVFLAACVASAAAFAPAALPTATRRASTVSGEARARPLFPAGAGDPSCAGRIIHSQERCGCWSTDFGRRRAKRPTPRMQTVRGGPAARMGGWWAGDCRNSVYKFSAMAFKSEGSAMQVEGHNAGLLERSRNGGSASGREKVGISWTTCGVARYVGSAAPALECRQGVLM